MRPTTARPPAQIYSLVATAHANGHNEYAYLNYVFTHLPAAKTNDEIAALLPWTLSKADLEPMLHVPIVSTT